MEYYSAIKRNTFESVLIRWMNLESIIQSEVSQKEKNKYRILTHINRIQKDSTVEPNCRERWRCLQTEKRLWIQNGGRKERVGCRVTWKHTLSYIKQMANGIVSLLKFDAEASESKRDGNFGFQTKRAKLALGETAFWFCHCFWKLVLQARCTGSQRGHCEEMRGYNDEEPAHQKLSDS